MKYYTLFLCIIALTSCTPSNENREVTYFDRVLEIVPIDTLRSDNIYTFPSYFDVIEGNVLLFRQLRSAAQFYRLSDLRLIGQFGEKGRASNEFISPYFAGYKDQSIYAYDVSTRRITECELDFKSDTTIVSNFSYIDISKRDTNVIHSGVVLDNGIFVAKLLNDRKDYIVAMDSSFNEIAKYQSPFPQFNNNGKDQIGGLFEAHRNSFLFRTFGAAFISFFEYNSNGELMQCWERQFKPVEFVDDHGEIKFNRTSGRIYGPKITDNYIYLLYRPNDLDDDVSHILILDYRGDPVVKLVCNQNLYGIALSDDEKTLYGLCGETDLLGLYLYDLSDVMNDDISE